MPDETPTTPEPSDAESTKVDPMTSPANPNYYGESEPSAAGDRDRYREQMAERGETAEQATPNA